MERSREGVWSARRFLPNRQELRSIIRIVLFVWFAAYAANFLFGFDLLGFVRENQDLIYGRWLLKPFFLQKTI